MGVPGAAPRVPISASWPCMRLSRRSISRSSNSTNAIPITSPATATCSAEVQTRERPCRCSDRPMLTTSWATGWFWRSRTRAVASARLSLNTRSPRSGPFNATGSKDRFTGFSSTFENRSRSIEPKRRNITCAPLGWVPTAACFLTGAAVIRYSASPTRLKPSTTVSLRMSAST